MKATLKLLIATFVTAIGITFPILATDTAILADDTAVRIFQAGTSNTICELQRSADNPNIYTGTATKAEIIKAANGNENYFQAKLNISIGTEILKCDYQSYFLGTTTPFPTTAIEYSTDKTDQTYFGVECPYEKFLFTVEVTSPTTATLLITDKTPTPMSMILNGESLSWCEDINEAGDYIEYGNIQVDDGETKSIQVKIGVDTYGVDATAGNNPMTFDAGNFGKQEKTAVLTKGADAVVLDINGLYTVAVVKNGSERHLSITKAAAGDEMTFGETGLVYDESAREWSGKVTLTDDQTLPALTYTNHIDPTKSHTYYFPSDIDDEMGDKTQTGTLTDN